MEELTYITEGKNQYTVFWDHSLNGGGMLFGPEYPFIIKELFPDRVFDTCLEWCSGPGFIGYNLLDHGICEKLVLNDIHKPALDMANKTMIHNNLQDKVQLYCSGKIDDIPKHIRFDLVVGNPPHYNRKWCNDNSRIADDENWLIHEYFYKNITDYLTDDGVILLQENADGSRPEEFYNMISDANLEVEKVIQSPNHYTSAPTLIYYILSHKASK